MVARQLADPGRSDIQTQFTQARQLGIGLATLIAVGVPGCTSISQGLNTPPAFASTTNRPTATSSAGGEATTLSPMKHFRIGDDYGPLHDCRVTGTSVTCTLTWAEPYSVESYTGTVIGTFSGTTLTGTSTTHQRFHDEVDPRCIFDQDTSGPVTYEFSLDGTVTMRGGPSDVQATRSGSCSGTESGTTSQWESFAKWSAIE